MPGLDLPLLAAIEEEAGSEASAREIVEITELVKEYGIQVIFTEVNGSDATANAIRRETGCRVDRLTMLMDGPEPKASDLELGRLCNYFNYGSNIVTVIDSFAGRRVVPLG